MKLTKVPVFLGLAAPAFGAALVPRQSDSLDACPGYKASNVKDDGATVTANLELAGASCNVYGQDLVNLKLKVEYQTGE